MLETPSDYVTEAAVILSDVPNTRYTAEMIRDGLANGLRDMQRTRPDIFMGITVPSDVTGATSLVFLENQFRSALLNYAVGFCFGTDQEGSNTGLAQYHMGLFKAAMQGA